jgi:hypothetical protein
LEAFEKFLFCGEDGVMFVESGGEVIYQASSQSHAISPASNMPRLYTNSNPWLQQPELLVIIQLSCAHTSIPLNPISTQSQWIRTHPKEVLRQPQNPLLSIPTNQPPELINIHTAFHAGAYQQVLDFDTSSFSPSNALPSRVLKLRSQIALGQAKEVASSLAKESTPDLVAVRLLAENEAGKDVIGDVKKLVEKYGQDNLTVQLVGGIVLERAGETEEALAVLSKHQGSLDAYVLPFGSLGPVCEEGR